MQNKLVIAAAAAAALAWAVPMVVTPTEAQTSVNIYANDPYYWSAATWWPGPDRRPCSYYDPFHCGMPVATYVAGPNVGGPRHLGVMCWYDSNDASAGVHRGFGFWKHC